MTPARYGHLYARYAAAYVRGLALRSQVDLPVSLSERPLDELSDEELGAILAAGQAAGVRLYRFKNTHDDLPRVKRVLGFLRSVQVGSLLDVGSGRGVFLWPCLNAFPWWRVTSVDLLPHRVEMINTVRDGGVANLSGVVGDICSLNLPESYDVVTLLEVLEHMPEPSLAVEAAVRLAGKHVVVSVPSKPDNNPEHLHLLTKDRLTELFGRAGCTRLSFDGVPGHLIMIATVGS